ncbi:Mo-dependent nitrogenase C-terminal domain-containing protein [Gloeocapsopsis dulcis]|uniref:Nitrogenase n=1 Tax=Gloeocapsopsis dulcis AAB1 = 1H9 TaxID=1433147 RepID=A0A6N8FU81_9CHRO|nr:Mo-dependent nitrogenase C-terminal domain-containing protein [Gloeocapsopsis dulcis]MUL36680.1 nitrogenase [Gloeocapsopsis dulcis AAB1 = 1H9]WNN91255.1 Mo-dependent nitrogenase C-terminal domain-containing protein [Gloeocapsopsis dulcis]
MTSVVKSPYTNEQIVAWLRGLLSIAWADGNFDSQEQEIITALTQELTIDSELESFEKISPEELASALKDDPTAAENFLRTAVMVAIADGTYSSIEDEIIHQFCQALGLQETALVALRQTLCDFSTDIDATSLPTTEQPQFDVLYPVRDWLDKLDIHDPKVARFLCKMIPPQCPFERDVKLFGKKIVHIPPLCKLNPLYEQLVGLRFRALSYLADECHEDVTEYC